MSGPRSYISSYLSLNDLLTKDEINEIKNYPAFKQPYTHNDLSEDIPFEKQLDSLDKNDLIIKFINCAINKLNIFKETTLSKCLIWSRHQIQINYEFKPDANTFKNIEHYELKRPTQQIKLGWMKECSLLNNHIDIFNIIKKDEKENKRIFTAPHKRPSFTLLYQPLRIPSITSNKINSVSEELLNFESPSFNIFKLEQSIGEANILPTVSIYACSSLGLYTLLDYNKFESFVFEITKGYNRRNPYHTDLHAADLVQTALLFVIYGDLQRVLHLTTVDLTALFLAGIIHDYKHPGLTNNYLINVNNEIALRFNDMSVLENYHVSEAFNLIYSNPNKFGIFHKLSNDDYKIIRKRIVQCVLSTDMTLHNKQYQFLKTRINTFNIHKGENVEKVFEGVDSVTKFTIQQEFLNVMIHAADVSNPTKPLDIYLIWAQKVVDEFFIQGDKERELGMKISFLCDRNTVSLPQSQLGFIEGVVQPMYNMIVEFFPELEYATNNINVNMEYFKKEKAKEDEEKKTKEMIMEKH